MIFQDERELAEHFKMSWSDVVELVGKNFWSIIPDPADPGFELIEVSPEQARRLRTHGAFLLRQRAARQQAAERAKRAKEREREIARRLEERRRDQARAQFAVGPSRGWRPRAERPESRGN